MRNVIKAALASVLMVSMPLSSAMASRPASSVPTSNSYSAAKPRHALGFDPIYILPIGIAVAIIAYTLAHKDKREAPPVSRG